MEWSLYIYVCVCVCAFVKQIYVNHLFMWKDIFFGYNLLTVIHAVTDFVDMCIVEYYGLSSVRLTRLRKRISFEDIWLLTTHI